MTPGPATLTNPATGCIHAVRPTTAGPDLAYCGLHAGGRPALTYRWPGIAPAVTCGRCQAALARRWPPTKETP